MNSPLNCPHRDFHIHANVTTSDKGGKITRVANISIICTNCNSPFSFVAERGTGVTDRPVTDVLGLTLSAPIRPGAELFSDFFKQDTTPKVVEKLEVLPSEPMPVLPSEPMPSEPKQ